MYSVQEHRNYILLKKNDIINVKLMIFVTLAKEKDRTPWRLCRFIKTCRGIAIYEILFMCKCCAFVGLDNKNH